MKKTLFFLVLSLVTISSWADESGFCGSNVIWTYSETNKSLVISGLGRMSGYNEYYYLDIEGFSQPWIKYQTQIEKITIEEGVKSIGNYAFIGCTSLVSVEIPFSVSSIGNNAFNGCTSLVSIEIPSGVRSIGSDAFKGCTNLDNIEISNFVEEIGANAFTNTKWYDKQPDGIVYVANLLLNYKGIMPDDTHLQLKEGIQGISGNAFYGCTGLVSIVIPTSVTTIASGVFSGCTGLTSIEIPNSVTSIGSDAFKGCAGLNSIEIPNSVKSIGIGAFSGCTGLTSIEIPNSIVSIGNNCFENCTSLVSIEIPNSVESIGSYAFAGCSCLPSIEIPNSVVSIGSYAFNGCTVLDSIKITESLKNIGNNTFVGTKWYDSKPDGIVYLGDWLYNYKGTMPENTQLEVRDGTRRIFDCAFYGCSELTSIVIPNSVVSIGKEAFSGCTGLNSVKIPNSVISIDSYAFNGCSGLVSIEIPDRLESIEEFTFFGCTGLSSIVIPNSVLEIKNAAFSGCTGLTSVVIPSSVEIVKDNAFYNCTNIDSLYLNISVNAIYFGLIQHCKENLKYLRLGDEVTSITYLRINNLSELASIVVDNDNPVLDSRNNCNAIIRTQSNQLIAGCKNTIIPESVTSIGSSAFNGCVGLVSIEIHQGVKEISSEAFSNCSGLTSIVVASENTVYDSRNNCNAIIETKSNKLIAGCKNTIIPENVTTIGSSAFLGCSELTSIEIPGSVSFIEDYAFKGCLGLTSVQLSDSVYSIGYEAFSGCTNLISIGISSDVTYIGQDAFKDTDWYNNQPDGIVYIGKIVYKYKGSIPYNSHIQLKEGTKGITSNAFARCSGLFSIEIPSSVKSIGMLGGCDGLSSVEIHQGVTIIDDYAFSGCTGLKSVIIPTSVTSIGSNAFASCISLNTITIPVSVNEIGQSAFSECESLTTIEIPNSVISIKYGTFIGCSRLTTLVIPSSVEQIDEYAFWGCAGLKDIYCYANIIPIIYRQTFSTTTADNVVLYVLSHLIKQYKEHSQWGGFKNIVALDEQEINSDDNPLFGHTFISGNIRYEITSPSNSVKVISLGDGNRYRDTVTIPSSVQYENVEYEVRTIGAYAFEDCNEMTSVTIPQTVKRINEGAFKGCSALTTITVPDNVAFIDMEAFSGCSKLVSINIPNTVRIIESGTFMNCSELTKITIPESVTTIKMRAFQGCTGLDSLFIPRSVAIIEYTAFMNCSHLSSITVDPENVYYDSRNNCNAVIESITIAVRMGGYADDHYQLVQDRLVLGCKNTTIPSSVTRIGIFAFTGCSELDSLFIPSQITEIENGAISGCNELISIKVDPDNEFYDSRDNCNAIINSQTNTLISGCKTTIIPETVTSIVSAFINQTELSQIDIPEGVVSILNAFDGCTNLKTISLPNSLTNIEKSSFYGCKSLTKIDIPKSVTVISDYSFYGCANLDTITIPATVTYIGSYAFSGCKNLSSIIALPERPDTIKYHYEPFDNNDIANCSLYVPSGCYYYYKERKPWSGFKEIIPLDNKDCVTIDGINYKVVSLGDRTVSVSYGVYTGDIIIPSTVQIHDLDYSVIGVEREAFVKNKRLTSVTLPEGVTFIGDYAFSECDSLTTVLLPEGVKSVGLAFYECGGLSSVTIPSSIKSIEDKAFYNCKSLRTIDLPSTIRKIGKSAFLNCNSLTSITIPDGVKAIDDNTFYGCNSLSYLYIPSSVDTIGIDVFKDCFKLQSAGPQNGGYNYEFSWDIIPPNAFVGLSSLNSIIIPKTVKEIWPVSETISKAYDVDCFDNYGFHRSICIDPVFVGCDSLKSIAISLKDTKMIKHYNSRSTSLYSAPMDYCIYLTTPIKKIILLDDTIKSLYPLEIGEIDEICISENVVSIFPGVFREITKTVNTISVDNRNACYSSYEGVLISDDEHNLVAFPPGFTGNYTIPDNVVTIADSACFGIGGLHSIIIPTSVLIIGERSFENCDSLNEVIIKGSPVICYNAFSRCNNIERVVVEGKKPCEMETFDMPQTIIFGEFNNPDSTFSSQPLFYESLGKMIPGIYREGFLDWTYNLYIDDIPKGNYKIRMGILPNTIDSMPNYVHPVISGVADNNEVVLFDSARIIRIEIIPGSGTFIEQRLRLAIINNMLRYDTVTIVDNLEIADDYNQIKISINSMVNLLNNTKYSSVMMLHQLYFEPLDQDMPEERYAGVFSEKVFNNATLFVPEDALDSYQTATGWKLFKNVVTTSKVKDIERVNYVLGKDQIYDINGRNVRLDSNVHLQKGIYIINGKKVKIL